MPSIGTNSKPAYVYDAGTDTWIPIGPGEHTHEYIGKDVITTTGDIIYASAANTPARRGIGSTGQVLTVSGGVPTWAAPSAPSYTWSAWTPASRNDMTIGNGTETARYSQIGNTVFWFYSFIFGSTSSIASSPAIQLPIATTATWESSYGDCLLVDASPGINYAGAAFYIINDKVQFQGQKADGTWSTINDIGPSLPFSWTTNDKIYAYGYYEVV
jgi:hypothetical protein